MMNPDPKSRSTASTVIAAGDVLVWVPGQLLGFEWARSVHFWRLGCAGLKPDPFRVVRNDLGALRTRATLAACMDAVGAVPQNLLTEPLDRLLHHSGLVVTSRESFRLEEVRQKGGGRKLT